jgi:DNA-directed RNA polymerase II subunit RPB3
MNKSYKLLSSFEDRYFVKIDNINLSEANKIRRILLSSIETLCIEDVVIELNEAPIHDETLASRLGLIPIVSDCIYENEDFEDFEPLILEASSNSEVKRVLSCDIYSIEKNNKYKTEILPASDKYHIVTLGEYQSLYLRLHLKKGIASEHGKWSPVSNVSYECDDEEANNYIFSIETTGSLRIGNIMNACLKKYDALK